MMHRTLPPTVITTNQIPAPAGATSGSSSHSNRHHGVLYSPITDQVMESCWTERSPSLPDTFALEIGIIRLFARPSFKDEIDVVTGCGCVTLDSPMKVKSFVGSRNHSFVLYTSTDCKGEPYFQRFKQYYNLEPPHLASSIRIVQGVLSPTPV